MVHSGQKGSGYSVLESVVPFTALVYGFSIRGKMEVRLDDKLKLRLASEMSTRGSPNLETIVTYWEEIINLLRFEYSVS